MKKTLLAAGALLVCVMLFSFTANTDADEIVITVTADKPTKFDMFQNTKVVKGLTTPYELKLQSDDARFIFKTKNLKTNLKIEARKKGASVSATWPITVLIVSGSRLTTFGMD